MSKERLIYGFLILTTLTTKKLHIYVASENALVNGKYNWQHLMEIAANRLGQAIGRNVAPDKRNFQLDPIGQYLSIPRPKRPTKKTPPVIEPPPSHGRRRKQREQSLVLAF